MTTPPVSVTPLGGVGEFGMNCMLLEHDGTRIMIDCGVMFPEPEHAGVDLLIPEFACLAEKAASGRALDALYVTHGHEDHIGGIPYLLQAIHSYGDEERLVVYSPAFSAALIRRRLDEHNLLGAIELRVVGGGLVDQATGPFQVEYIAVNHSIPDAFSLAITTPQGVMVHTGDWRVDYTPVNEAPIDLARFAEIGANGVRLLLADSTNAQRPGMTISESVVAEALTDVFDIAPGRVIVTMFSSNLWRLQSIIDAAHETRRRVAVVGRSLRHNLGLAREMGYLRLPEPGIVVDVDTTDRMSESSVVLVIGGSQGEPQSNLTRMAFGEHNFLDVHRGDWFIYSSRRIPGNEKRISHVVDALVAQGAKVLVPGERKLHASGHACAGEMRLLLRLLNPRHFVPVHGSFQQLAAHADLARSLSHDPVMIRDGDTVNIDENGLTLNEDRVPTGPIYVAGGSFGQVDDEILRQRRQIGFCGIVMAQVRIGSDGEMVGEPMLTTYGVTCDDSILQQAAQDAVRTVREEASSSSESALSEAVRVGVRRSLRKSMGRKPVVIPVLVRIGT